MIFHACSMQDQKDLPNIMENKVLPRTVLRLYSHKFERNLMQSLELALIISWKDTHLLVNIVFTCKHCEILSIKYLCVSPGTLKRIKLPMAIAL